MTPERDGVSSKTLALALGPSTLSADNTPAAIDLRGYRKATLILAIGVGGITFDGTNKIEYKLTHSSDNVTYTDVTEDDIVTDSFAPATITSGIIRALTAAHAAPTAQKLGYIGGKRYVKLLSDFAGTHGTGTPASATWILEDAGIEGAA